MPVGEEIEKELGIPIVNKRISVTPIAIAGGAARGRDAEGRARARDRAAETTGVNYIGGYTALVQKGATPADLALIAPSRRRWPKPSASARRSTSLPTKAGINGRRRRDGHVIKKAAALSADRGLGCAKLVVFANAPEDNPFMAGAFHGISGATASSTSASPARAWCASPRRGLRFNRAGGNHQAHRL